MLLGSKVFIRMMAAANTSDLMNKQVRKFECRDDVWARVEALANNRGVSTDEIVQGALVQVFSRKRVASAKTTGAGKQPPPGRSAPPPASSRRTIPSLRDPSAPPPREASDGRASAKTPESTERLYITVAGKVHVVDRDEFVIGRAPRACQLAIKDANISRKHCRVVRREGQFFICDLGSTNGVEFEGHRVDNHRIMEGAVYRLCDHELRCTYAPPS
jgi:hypothetical protein